MLFYNLQNSAPAPVAATQTQILFIRLLTYGWQIQAGSCLVHPNISCAVPFSEFSPCRFSAGYRKTRQSEELCNARCERGRNQEVLLPWLARRASRRPMLSALHPISRRGRERRRLHRRWDGQEALFPLPATKCFRRR